MPRLPHIPRVDNDAEVQNILSDQFCLLPNERINGASSERPSPYGVHERGALETVDSVILFGSEVLQCYWENESAGRYAAEINLEHHGIIPFALDGRLLTYLPYIKHSDVHLKIDVVSDKPSFIHRIYFRLLKRIYTKAHFVIEDDESCYTASKVRLGQEGGTITRETLSNIVFEKTSEARANIMHRLDIGVRDALKLQEFDKRVNDDHRLFQDWQHREDAALLWVFGEPGCGKSVLARYLVDDILPAPGSTVCYFFFFKDGSPDQSTPVNAIRCLLQQIFVLNPASLSVAMISKFEKSESIYNSREELWDIFKEVTRSTSKKPIICVLDALDECEEDGRSWLVKKVEAIFNDKSTSSSFRLLLTSRPAVDLDRFVRDWQSRSFITHLNGFGYGEAAKISTEVQHVIAKGVEILCRKLQLRQHDEKDLLEILTKFENRTYLWVTLVFQVLNKGPPEPEPEEWIEEMLNGPSGLLIIDRDFRIHLAHLTVREFLVQTSPSSLPSPSQNKSVWQESFRIEESQRIPAEVCLSILDQDYSEGLAMKGYAVENWVSHFRKSHTNDIRMKTRTRVVCPTSPTTALMVASPLGLKVVVDLLLSEERPDLHSKDNWHQPTAFGWACRNGCKDVVESFFLYIANFSESPDVNDTLKDNILEIRDGYGRTPLNHATSRNHLAVVRLLLSQGASPNSWDKSARNGLLLRYEADVDSQDEQGLRLLHIAARLSDVDAVGVLLKHGATIDAQNKNGRTPLHIILGSEDPKARVTKMLLGNKALVNVQDNSGRTPLRIALETEKPNVYVIEALISHDALVDAQNTLGRAPLGIAVEENAEHVLSMPSPKALVDTGDEDGQIQRHSEAGSFADKFSMLVSRGDFGRMEKSEKLRMTVKLAPLSSSSLPLDRARWELWFYEARLRYPNSAADYMKHYQLRYMEYHRNWRAVI
ncbi:putative NACHT domain-containing protein [Seiridium unicorne]|uniref:NACHT domain-containing protein n=1 Tax=Seiridium unicorne TaxID=138068 RepID=A0ABR2UMS3_9PEZI